MASKTKLGAFRQAKRELGPDAVEGMDFQVRNTGVGWAWEPVVAVNKAAKKAQRTRVKPSAAEVKAKKADAPKRVVRKPKAPPSTKTELLIGMMRTPEGSTSKAMEEAASWAPHSVRGLVGSLKKKGVPVESLKDPGKPVRYRIPVAGDDTIGDVI